MYNPTKPYKHEILRLIESTWKTPYLRVEKGVYPIITKRFAGKEVQHTDGIGTKGEYHWQKRTLKSAVIDALAMNLNDLAMAGAVPYALQDHLTLPDDGDKIVLELVRALATECRKYKIAITGGETSHHDTADSLDVSISVSGIVRYPQVPRFRVGDVLIGLKSSGLHSNGFTRVRKTFKRSEWRADFTKPTAIYLDTILSILEKHKVHGMMHITGGAFTKLKDLLKGADAIIEQPKSLAPQPIFHELYARGVSDKDMYTTFNCGVGFIIGVSPRDAERIIRRAPHSAVVGRVVKGSGKVHITSAFTGKQVVL
jgi:phosphoribosylformylglycinamidine cyclo-ligase